MNSIGEKVAFLYRKKMTYNLCLWLEQLHALDAWLDHGLKWLEIVSWRARPGPLIARARASTPGSRRCKSSDLVHSKILQNLYFDRKYLWKLTVKICKIWHSGKERAEISVLIERKNSVKSKQNERENRIIWNFSESFLQNFFKIGSLVGFNVQNNFSKFEKNSPYNFYGKLVFLVLSWLIRTLATLP